MPDPTQDDDEFEISQSEAEAIARGLFAVARADGHVHEREAALIAQFFAEVADSQSPAQLGALERAAKISGPELAAALVDPELRRMFLKTAYLLAYTDNAFGPGEAAAIKEFAAALEVPSAELEDLQVQAREHLLAQLAHLQNIDGVAAVGRELKE